MKTERIGYLFRRWPSVLALSPAYAVYNKVRIFREPLFQNEWRHKKGATDGPEISTKP